MDFEYVIIVMVVSLLATLVLEVLYALIWGVRGEDFKTVLLANVLTNPAVVLLTLIVDQLLISGTRIFIIVLLLELSAVAVEAQLYARRTRIRFPWAFSLCANALSFTVGLFLA